MVGTEETARPTDIAQVFGSSVEQRAINGEPCFNRNEIKELARLLQERGFKPEAITGAGELPSKHYEEYPEEFDRVCKALEWSNDRFYGLAKEIMVMFGEEFSLEEGESLDEIAKKVRERENPFRTFGEDTEDLTRSEKRYVYRMNGILDALYETLLLCAHSEDDELFPGIAGDASRSIGWQIARGKDRADSSYKERRVRGAKGHTVRHLPKGGYTRIIKEILRAPESTAEPLT